MLAHDKYHTGRPVCLQTWHACSVLQLLFIHHGCLQMHFPDSTTVLVHSTTKRLTWSLSAGECRRTVPVTAGPQKAFECCVCFLGCLGRVTCTWWLSQDLQTTVLVQGLLWTVVFVWKLYICWVKHKKRNLDRPKDVPEDSLLGNKL